ncbi:MAG: hypothetical protein H6972_01645 [Gammaproteobacteria bacterium]|nr:hypothetical protein [Gammaproteobacteria bacterium]
MACLFGYCGPPADGLLARMAALLVHRCPLGWEREDGATVTGDRVEIGHGIAAWNQQSQLARRDHDLLGYGGVLFNLDKPATPGDAATDGANRLLVEPSLRHAPEPYLEQLAGCFVLAASLGDAFICCVIMRASKRCTGPSTRAACCSPARSRRCSPIPPYPAGCEPARCRNT